MLILAPMQGLTELLFRKTYHSVFPNAFDYAISPFLSLTHGEIKDVSKIAADVLPQSNADSIPVVPQVLGHEKESFVELVKRLAEMGYTEVNWNMGCPMRRVAAKHRGSGILPYPSEVEEIISYVVPRINIGLSVKLRLGYRSPDEIDKIIPILNDYPLTNVTIHPRIGKQMYNGSPDMETFARILPTVKHTVIYNGDIFTVGDYRRIRERFPEVKDVMIGRGVLYDPLLPLKIKNSQFTVPRGFPARASQFTIHNSTIQQFIESLIAEITAMPTSDAAKVRKMKEYWCLLMRSVDGTEQVKRRVLHASDLDEVRSLILDMAK